MSVIALPRPRTQLPSLRAPSVSPAITAFALSSVFLMLFADAVIHDRSFFDTSLLKLAQKIDGPIPEAVFTGVNALTGSEGAIAAWLATMVTFLALRWWVPAMALAALPIGGAVNMAVGEVSMHVRPSGDEFIRTVSTNAPSFPSGHVMGAVMLYGFLFVVAGRIQSTPVRLSVRLVSVAVLSLVGMARLWEGAHWPSDVMGAYSLGGLVLLGIVLVYRRVDRAAGDLPLIKQGWFPHYGAGRHAHALTSMVFFNDDNTVSKVYSPGLLPRVLYWVSFQAAFPYVSNRAALRTAMARRNLAAYLTEYWYGSSKVARIVAIDEGYAGRIGIRSDFVSGHEPTDAASAKAFLVDLRNRFEEAGFPTWQIDPRQPRAVDNLIEVAPGDYRIVDLESGLVAPIASLKSWIRGMQRGQFPLYDDVFVDVTREYVTANAASIEATIGSERFAELRAELDELAEAQAEWQGSEPRLLGRFVGGFRSGWNYRAWPSRAHNLGRRGEEKATRVLYRAVDAWEAEGRVSVAEAQKLRDQVAGAEIRSVMPHLGAHGVISIFLRFPFGSIARPAWTLAALMTATGALLIGRKSFAQWKTSFSIHSPLVIIVSAIPGFGAFAYLLAAPVRKNRLLVRAVTDHLMLKVPGHFYANSRVRRILAPKAIVVLEPERQDSPAGTPVAA